MAVELCWSHFGVAFKSLWSHLGVTWRSLPSKQKPFSWIYAANNVDIRWYKNLKLSGFQSKNNIIQFKKQLLFISYLKQCSNQCYPPKKNPFKSWPCTKKKTTTSIYEEKEDKKIEKAKIPCVIFVFSGSQSIFLRLYDVVSSCVVPHDFILDQYHSTVHITILHALVCKVRNFLLEYGGRK